MESLQMILLAVVLAAMMIVIVQLRAIDARSEKRNERLINAILGLKQRDRKALYESFFGREAIAAAAAAVSAPFPAPDIESRETMPESARSTVAMPAPELKKLVDDAELDDETLIFSPDGVHQVVKGMEAVVGPNFRPEPNPDNFEVKVNRKERQTMFPTGECFACVPGSDPLQAPGAAGAADGEAPGDGPESFRRTPVTHGARITPTRISAAPEPRTTVKDSPGAKRRDS